MQLVVQVLHLVDAVNFLLEVPLYIQDYSATYIGTILNNCWHISVKNMLVRIDKIQFICLLN
ncbi:hypothetical protein EJ682_16755, partial [Salmonella enterica]|nr:hypothetical protein [Salmonella enterica]EAR4342990.1 hypothetical protein [Salmonella enterica]EBL2111675.1 hypothetical protein [Salmonella enterica]MFO17378.1 hypothetical protein [Salmonella enterica]